MKNKFLLFLNILAIIFSLCSCNNNSSHRKCDFYPGYDITEIFYPTNVKKGKDKVAPFFALLKVDGDIENVRKDELAMIQIKKVDVSKTYDCDMMSFDCTDVYIQFNLFSFYFTYGLVDYIPEQESLDIYYNQGSQLFFEMIYKYKYFLVYIDERAYDYSISNNEIKFGLDIYTVIPICDSKICINSVFELIKKTISLFIDDEKEVERDLLHMPVRRLNKLFEDGDDVYEDFPKKLEQYNRNYNKYQDEIRCF